MNKALAEIARKLTLQRLFKEVKGTGWEGDLADMRRTRMSDGFDAPRPKRKRVAAKTVSAPRQKATRAKRRSR